MTEVVVTGSIRSTVTHFAAHGLAEILVDAGVDGVAWGWRDGADPSAIVHADCSREELGEAVLRHASERASDSSWVQAKFEHGPLAGIRGVLSPRVRNPAGSSEWQHLEQDRRNAIDGAPGALDQRFIAALGRPSYWTEQRGSITADSGASRWDMKTRNQGEQFVGHRLAPLAQVMAQRSVNAILDGLAGVQIVDEENDRKRKSSKGPSQTATGLAPVGAVDSALAWCALWGLSATSVAWRGVVAPSTALAPWHRVHPTTAALPVFDAVVTPARFRHVLRSHAWSQVVDSFASAADGAALTQQSHADWLRMRGVRYCVWFPVLTEQGVKVPARHIGRGRLESLGGT